jgi:hypothetical protein
MFKGYDGPLGYPNEMFKGYDDPLGYPNEMFKGYDDPLGYPQSQWKRTKYATPLLIELLSVLY